MPNKPIKPADLFKVYQKKVSFIDGYLNSFDRDLKQLQRELAMQIVAEYIPRFDVKDGNLVLNQKNAKLLSDLNTVMDDFKAQFATNVFRKTADSMLKLTVLTSDYFRKMNFGAKTLANIADKLAKMQFTIGIDSKGKVIAGSFIDNLASTPEAKSLFADYIRKGLEGEMRYNDFVKGFKNLITGTPETDGALVRYAKNYVHDSVFSHSRAIDKFFADELNIDCFYYAGDLIDTSREWCVKHAGKIYKRSEIESWKDKDWAGKIPDEDPFIQLGGYGCRHNFMAVPCDSVSADEMATADPGIE